MPIIKLHKLASETWEEYLERVAEAESISAIGLVGEFKGYTAEFDEPHAALMALIAYDILEVVGVDE